MKKFLLKTVVPAVLGFSLIFAGCSADDGGSGGSSAVLSAVTLTAADSVTSVSASGSVKLTATVTGENLSNSEIRYVWTITEGEAYASLDGELTSTAKSLTAEKTLTVNNSITSEQTVKVTVKAVLGSTEKDFSIELKIAAKETSSSETESGSVSVEVIVDSSVSCKKCGKTYDLKTQAENCEHYKCQTCGSVYHSQEEADACTAHVTVIFTEADGAADANETVTKVIKSGTTVVAPAWEKEGFTLTWVTESGSEYDFDDPLSVADGETEKTVTFTAKWETTYTVTFKDESGTNADETAEVISGETVDSVPDWTREHYTLTGWTSSVEGLTVESAITEDVTFTAVWVEDAKYTVTFADSDGSNADVTQTVYTGEKASVPEWTKENYVLSWASSVEGISTDSEITQDVTFTANWTEKPKCSNCGTHYDTEEEAGNCSREEGCPKYGTLTTITFSGSKTATATSDNSSIAVSMTGNIKSGVTLTYNEVTYDPIIKMETATVITISGAAGKTIKVVCDAAKAIKYNNSTKVTAVADGTAYVATFTAPDGDSFTINKAESLNVGVIFIE